MASSNIRNLGRSFQSILQNLTDFVNYNNPFFTQNIHPCVISHRASQIPLKAASKQQQCVNIFVPSLKLLSCKDNVEQKAETS